MSFMVLFLKNYLYLMYFNFLFLVDKGNPQPLLKKHTSKHHSCTLACKSQERGKLH